MKIAFRSLSRIILHVTLHIFLSYTNTALHDVNPTHCATLHYSPLQIDPDDRPNFEEIYDFLESIHLPDEPEDEDKESPDSILPGNMIAEPHRDLRACISEPSILLTDDRLPPEDDSRSCGSEGESRLIIEHHKHRLLGSLGSSTGSSCGSVLEDPEGVEPEADGVLHHVGGVRTGTPERGEWLGREFEWGWCVPIDGRGELQW